MILRSYLLFFTGLAVATVSSSELSSSELDSS